MVVPTSSNPRAWLPPTPPLPKPYYDAAHASCDSPNNLTAFGASNACLIRENPTCSVQDLQGCEGLRSSGLRPHMKWLHHPTYGTKDYDRERYDYTPPPPSPLPHYVASHWSLSHLTSSTVTSVENGSPNVPGLSRGVGVPFNTSGALHSTKVVTRGRGLEN